MNIPAKILEKIAQLPEHLQPQVYYILIEYMQRGEYDHLDVCVDAKLYFAGIQTELDPILARRRKAREYRLRRKALQVQSAQTPAQTPVDQPVDNSVDNTPTETPVETPMEWQLHTPSPQTDSSPDAQPSLNPTQPGQPNSASMHPAQIAGHSAPPAYPYPLNRRQRRALERAQRPKRAKKIPLNVLYKRNHPL